jgi:hypothetical protein
MLWYLIADIVQKACGRDYLLLIREEEYAEFCSRPEDPNNCYNMELKVSFDQFGFVGDVYILNSVTSCFKHCFGFKTWCSGTAMTVRESSMSK